MKKLNERAVLDFFSESKEIRAEDAAKRIGMSTRTFWRTVISLKKKRRLKISSSRAQGLQLPNRYTVCQNGTIVKYINTDKSKSNKVSGQKTTTAQEVKGSGGSMKANEVLQSISKPKFTHEQVLAHYAKLQYTNRNLEMAWRSFVKLHHPEIGIVLTFKMKERGQMSKISAILQNRTLDVLALTVKNWAKFGKYCESHHGAKGYPLMPQIGFLLVYVQAALSLYQEETKVKEPVSAKAKAPLQLKPTPANTQTFLDVVGTDGGKASLEEIMKINEQDDA